MQRSLQQRSNEAWIDAMHGRGAESAAAVRELEVYLERMLGRITGRRLLGDDAAELVQETLTRIVNSLDSFRGDSAFTTWAAGIATRVAFTELRRRQVRATRQGAFEAIRDTPAEPACPRTPRPDENLSRADLLEALHRAIEQSLTARQRLAVLAELRGIPTVEIAARLGTNQNALYKLTHDARKKLRQALLDDGFSADSLHELATEASR